MKEKALSISQIYQKGKANLRKMGSTWTPPPGADIGVTRRMNRRCLDSLFFIPKYLDPVEVNTGCEFWGVPFRTPIFCSPISQTDFVSDEGLVEIARGVKRAGALMMLGIGGSSELQKSIDLGAKVAKIVKPYREISLIYKKVREAEERGCVAVGMDIDHFYGRLVRDEVSRDDIFAPQKSEEIKQVIAGTKLPFIIKGVLSTDDAKKAVQFGASGIIVSNHGTAAIDFSIPSMLALPKISESVGQKLTIFVDTGFRTGNDTLKAIAFGAKAVGFASPMLLAYAADAAAGVELLINQITAELRRTMAAVGLSSVSGADRSFIHPSPFLE
jgi:4-hydroxymandelate oxidase